MIDEYNTTKCCSQCEGVSENVFRINENTYKTKNGIKLTYCIVNGVKQTTIENINSTSDISKQQEEVREKNGGKRGKYADRGLKYCGTCKILMSRDGNAARNIHKCFINSLKDRPLYLRRPPHSSVV